MIPVSTIRIIALIAIVILAIWSIPLFIDGDLWSRLKTNLSHAERMFFIAALTLSPLVLLVGADLLSSISFLRKNRLGWINVVIVFAGSLIALIIFDRNNPTPSVIVGAATVATIGWIVQYVNSRDLQRRQHTLNVLLQFRNSVEFNKHEHGILKRYPFGQEIPADDIETLSNEIRDADQYVRHDPGGGEHESIPTLLSIRHVLNYYEFIAAAIRAGDLDKALIRNTLGGIMDAFFEKAKPIIRHYYSQDHENYEHFRWLVTHWADNDDGSNWNPVNWEHD